MDPVTLTDESLETGLRGVPVGYCPTSKVDPYKGLSYGGYAIPKLAHRDPADVIYLLLNRVFPTPTELASFKSELIKRATMPVGLNEYLKALPKDGHPMKWFICGIVYLGMKDTTGDYREDCLNLIARLPELCAKIFAIREGREPNESKPELGYIENFVHVLNLPEVDQAKLTRLIRIFDILHFDHGGGNLSTFVGKTIASGLEDTYGSIAGAMAALAGPRHGKANQECLDFLQATYKDLNGNVDDEAAMLKFLERRYENKGLLYGFGHAVLRSEDPRATVQFELGEEICPKDPLFRLAKTYRKVGTEFLKSKEKVQCPYVNVDSVSGSLLSASGLTDPEYYTVLFGMSRSVGIAVQIIYERVEAKGGKGTPIVRPRYIYSGPKGEDA